MDKFKRVKSDVPLLIILEGLPGSGKSTFAKSINTTDFHGNSYVPQIHSSDKLREELFGDEKIQNDNNRLFRELHKRIKSDLRNGIDVIYDATNIKKKNRIQFLNEMSTIKHTSICVCLMTTYDSCLINNKHRKRNVPEDVIKRMYYNWQPPHYSEGFDEIYFVQYPLNDKEKSKYKINNFFKIADKFDQQNSHHQLTLGEHCAKAATYILNNKFTTNNYPLSLAALMHDNGKLVTKTQRNAKGKFDGDCHYYQHHCVGSYEAFFYLYQNCCEMKNQNSILYLHKDDLIYIMNLIYYHMHPYCAWEQSNRAKERDKKLLGKTMFNDIMCLHDADLYAH